ncbi:hypothetical protein GCK32_012942 [Trichostrongylus colubriformis]|uniref:Uncharacterized protein n=1 Tax=Trichostrongylus colubriformis TaxID=6319 RepID=A0AAN8IBH7_TRICO
MSKNAGPITGRDVLSFINTALKKYYGTHLWSRHYEEENTGEAVPDADAGDSVASSNSEVLSVTQEVQNDEETAVEGAECDDEASSFTAMMLPYGPYGEDAEEYSLNGRKMRRTCVFCGRISSVKTMKQTLRNKKLTLILTSSLSLIGCVNRADVGNMVEEFSNHVKHFCRSHVVEAAQYLSAEVLATGKRFSFYNDPSARGIIAYFITTDIPSNVVEMISGMSNNTVPITARDVMSFINAALKKYYGTPMWSRHYEEQGNFAKAVTRADTDDSADSSYDEPFPNVEEGARRDMRMALECDETGDEVSEEGRSSCDSESSSVMLLEDFGETDPADLRKYFVVQGDTLLELFRFCPECGDRLGKTQLKAVGGAAAVTFVCQRCAMKPVVRRFEYPTRALIHIWKDISEGNVRVPASAVTTSVQHTKLEPWAEQMNLSMFGIDEVANNHERV